MKVLVVEDDQQLNLTLQRLLVEWGHSSAGVERLDQARLYLQTQTVDCLVLDLSLPDGDGLGIIRELRRGGNTIPFIVVTGTGDITQSSKAVELGVMGIIVKPFIFDQLFENICKAQSQTQQTPFVPIVEDDYWHTYIVALMQATARCWNQETGTGIAALGERSGAWTVTISKDSARARTLERYLKLDQLPSNPKLGPVFQTAEYVLNQFPESEYAEEIRMQLKLLQLKTEGKPLRFNRRKSQSL